MLSIYHEDFYHPSACNVCKDTRTLKICAKCKCLSYCCKEHQRQDWTKHRRLCKIIYDTDKELSVDVKFQLVVHENIIAKGERDLYYITVENIWKKKLRRDLDDFEKSVLMFRKLCIVCNSTNTPICCEKCSSVFYCSDEHKKNYAKKHDLYCAKLKLNFELLLFNYTTRVRFIPLLSKKSIPLKQLPQNLEKLMDFLQKGLYIMIPKKISFLEHLTVKDSFAPAANVLFGLERSGLLTNRNFMKQNLVVHIVGADFEERRWNWCLLLEFVFHWIKNLKHLTFAVVGRRAGNWTYALMNMTPICGSCNMNPFNIKLFSSPNDYHDVVDDLEKPDMVVAFNFGIYDISTLKKSIPSLIKYPKVPLVLTNYRLQYMKHIVKEIKNNIDKEIQVILKPQKNPFSCLTPQRFDLKKNPICYKNAYIAIIKLK